MSAASKSACTREISDAASRAALSPTSASLMARTKTPMALEMALKPSFIVCLFSARGFSATFSPYLMSLADAAATSRAPTRTARCKEGKVRETGRKEAKNKESSPSCQDPQLNLQPLWTRRRSGSLWKRKASAPSFCAISSALTTRKRAAKARSTMRIGATSRPIAKTCFISDVCSCRPTKIVPRPAGGCVALKSFHDNTTWSFDATDIAS